MNKVTFEKACKQYQRVTDAATKKFDLIYVACGRNKNSKQPEYLAAKIEFFQALNKAWEKYEIVAKKYDRRLIV